MAALTVWGVTLSFWKCQSPSECTMDMSECSWSEKMLTLPVRVVSRPISVTISRQLQTPHTTSEAPTAWTVTCWHIGWMDSWRFTPYPYTFMPDTIRNETRHSLQCFSSHQHFIREAGSYSCGINICVVYSTSVQEWACGSKTRYQWRTVESSQAEDCWFPSNEIHSWRGFARLSRLRIVVSHQLPRSFKGFHRLHNYRWCFTGYLLFVVTPEMALRKNLNCIATSEF